MSSNSIEPNDGRGGRIPRSRGMLIVVSSPSGGGKGTLIKRALKIVPDLGYSVSYTTRLPREGEIDGKDYFFISLEQFASMVNAGEFLEWAVVHGNNYGTAKRQVEHELAIGRDIILEIDVQGAEAVRRIAPQAVEIFILPPSYEVLRERLIGRGVEQNGNYQLRLKNSRTEVQHYTEFDYVIFNEDVEQAAAELAAIVITERTRTDRQKQWADEVISTFPAAVQDQIAG